MNPGENGKAGEYRRTAATLRLVASQVRFAEGHHRLLVLAENFERLAQRVEAWQADPALVAANAEKPAQDHHPDKTRPEETRLTDSGNGARLPD